MGDNGLAAPSPYPENHRIYISVLYYLELVFFFYIYVSFILLLNLKKIIAYFTLLILYSVIC
jgi:hypothetical protein